MVDGATLAACAVPTNCHRFNFKQPITDTTPRSRGANCARALQNDVPRRKRAQGMPDAQLAPAASRAKLKKHTSVVTTGRPQSTGIPRAMVLTVSFVLSPVTGLSCHRRRRNYFRQLDTSVGAPGPHDFAVRVSIARLAALSRPLHPVPRFVTIMIRPSCRDGIRGRIALIWV
jgi:hypothetical protein